jgi:putative tryptophan/tyrosine transport system substrate-binding protein
MKRREAMALLASAAAWPLASRAQQATPVIGFLSSRSPAESAPLVAAFREGLRESGHFEGRDVQIVFRWAEGRYERLPEMAADLVGQRIALLVSVGGEVTALAAKAATATIPIVFVIGSDAVETGLVASLARPGGNVTGATLMGGALGAKRLELLREMLPDPSVIGFLVNPDHPRARADTAEVHEAAGPLAQPILVVDARTDSDLEHAFKTLAQSRARGLIVNRDGFLNSRRERIMALAARHELPAIYESREHAMAGGLMSYGTSYAEIYRQAGLYAGRVLNGAKPTELPVVQPTKFEFIINLKTAQALGLPVTPTLLARADEVIE